MAAAVHQAFVHAGLGFFGRRERRRAIFYRLFSVRIVSPFYMLGTGTTVCVCCVVLGVREGTWFVV